MQKLTILTLSVIALITLQSCSIMEPIGKENFACPNEKKGGVCAGPRTIYELTNTRPNLENLEEDADYDGYVIKSDDEGNAIAVKVSTGKKQSIENKKTLHSVANNDVVYEPRDHTQQALDNHQTPKVVPQIRSLDPSTNQDSYSRWPTTTEPLAPEPLSVLEPPKVMRILLNSYKDGAGNLHMPGYLFVQVEAETWSVGEAASLRPQRVIPLEIMEKAKTDNSKRKYRQQGVSSLEHQEQRDGG